MNVLRAKERTSSWPKVAARVERDNDGACPAPKVSVCIPTYNRARFIGEAIESVLAQTFQDFEIIVYDDASTDATATIVHNFNDPRIRYFRQARRVGISRNRNSCLAVARGNYIGWLDSDDAYLPHMLEDETAILDRHPNVGLVHAQAHVIDGGGRLLGERIGRFRTEGTAIHSGYEAFKELCVSNYIVVPATLVRRVCYEQVGGYNPALSSAEDSEMWLRIALRYDLASLATPGARKRFHGGNVRDVLGMRRRLANRVRVMKTVFAGAPRDNPAIESLRHLGRASCLYYTLHHLHLHSQAGASQVTRILLALQVAALEPTFLLRGDFWQMLQAVLRRSNLASNPAWRRLMERVLLSVQDTNVGRQLLQDHAPLLPVTARVLLRSAAEWESRRPEREAVLREVEALLERVGRDARAILATEQGFVLLQRTSPGIWRKLAGYPPTSGVEAGAYLKALKSQDVKFIVVPKALQGDGVYSPFQRHVQMHVKKALETTRWVIYALGSYRGYEKLIEHIRDAVSTSLPPHATVAVVSKGDENLLDIGSLQAWHFPRDEDGGYAGYYPADSAQAIAHLEAVRTKGAEFLLLPSTALWWLDHYAEFNQYLEQHYPVVFRQNDVCVIFALRKPLTQVQRSRKESGRRAVAD